MKALFVIALLFAFNAHADREVIVRPGPQSCINTCSPTLNTCVTQCY